MESYLKKYLKYKKKYLNLLNQYGGNADITIYTEKIEKDMYGDVKTTYVAYYNDIEICSFDIIVVTDENVKYYDSHVEPHNSTCKADCNIHCDSDNIYDCNKCNTYIYLSGLKTTYLTLNTDPGIEFKRLVEEKRTNDNVTLGTQEFKKIVKELEKTFTYEGIKITDLKGKPTLIVKYVLSRYLKRYDSVVLFLQPLWGTDKARSYSNYYLNNDDLYKNLIKYYKDIFNIKKETKRKYDYSSNKDIRESSFDLSGGPCLNLVLYDNISNYITDNSYDNIKICEWGLGLENETVIYKTPIENATALIIPVGYLLQLNNIHTNVGIQSYLNIEECDKKLFTFNNLNEGNNCGVGSEMIEITTQQYKNNSISETINELTNNKKHFLNIIRGKLNELIDNIPYFDIKLYDEEYYNNVKLLYGSNIDINDSDNYDIMECEDNTYLGSYHLNITLPHLYNSTYNPTAKKLNEKIPDTFMERHLNFARIIQLLEPLIVTVYSHPDSSSFNDLDSKSESSFRLFVSNGTFIASAKLKDSIPSARQINKDTYNKHFTEIKDSFDYPILDDIGQDFSRRAQDAEKGRTSGFFGFEFRMLDNMPIEYIENLLTFLYLLAYYIEKNKIKIKNVTGMYPQIELSLKYGYNSPVNKAYFEILLNYFNDLSNNYKNTYDLLNNINKLLVTFYNDNIYNETDKILKSYKILIGNVKSKNLMNFNKVMMMKHFEYENKKKINDELDEHKKKINDDFDKQKEKIKDKLISYGDNKQEIYNYLSKILKINKIQELLRHLSNGQTLTPEMEELKQLLVKKFGSSYDKIINNVVKKIQSFRGDETKIFNYFYNLFEIQNYYDYFTNS